MNFVLKKLVTQLTMATVGAVFVATIVKVKPSQAASFTFTFGDAGSLRNNKGSLSFSDDSILMGVGRETADLSDLPDASFSLDFTSDLPLGGGGPKTASGFSFSNPTFDFNDGNLIGITSSSSVPIDVFDGRGFPNIVIEFKGSAEVALSGARFTESITGVETIFNAVSGQVFSTENRGTLAFYSGNISFQTIEPVSRASVPEPSDTIGLLAFGLLAFSQRKLFKRSRAFRLNKSSKNLI